MKQFAAIVATGNTMVVEAAARASKALATLPADLARLVEVAKDWRSERALDAVLFEGSAEALGKVLRAAAMRKGPIVPVITPGSDGGYDLNRLLEEKVVSVNTAAAGGNASLMTIG
jgi:RHH-type transcriptional regulator, proline utilization regulon repressor / proline dehydrogenase / delta 1-pyrroline-5-carboxylate dehydrogenase